MSLFRPAETRAIGRDSGVWVDPGMPSVSMASSLSIVPVYGAVRLISETIASLPIHAYRRTATGREQVALPAFIANPPDGSSTVDWVQRAMVSMLLGGAAVGIIVHRDARDFPDAVAWINPARATCETLPGTVRPVVRVDGIDRTSDVVYIPAVVMPGDPNGVNPVRAFATTFGGAREVQKARAGYAKRRQIPGSTLKNTKKTLTSTEADAVAARAETKIMAGGVFAYGADWDYSPVSLPAQDVAWLESVKADANQVATIYQVPPELIGGTSGGSLTYTTVEGQLNWILTMTTRTWITKLEAAVNRITPSGTYLKFSPDAVIRTDVGTRFSSYRTAREIGLRNIDELRELEDLPPLPDGQGQDYTPLHLGTHPAATTTTTTGGNP